MRINFKEVTIAFILAALLLPFHLEGAQEGNTGDGKRIYTTRRVQGTPPVIDGRLNDAVWESVEWSGGFIQRSPYYGQKPSQETQFKILYDAKNLYVGIRAFDTEPKKIETRLARRDNFAGDWVEINIDSYFDHRTAFSFTTTAAGVKGDEAISENGNRWDSSWNPIWYTRTAIDDQGWTAEIKIPFSQLRFGFKEKHTWGIQLTRRFFRKEERSTWQPIPQDAPGWVYLFGELRGIEGIKAPRLAELYPYASAKQQTFEKEEGNPFATGNSTGFSGGLDGKVGLASNMTLDFTVNPDFGQVEADPSEVNLTAFETFFPEKRPFFIEGKNILDFRVTEGDSSYSSDNLFYSRRIGRMPQYYPETGDNEFIDFPENTKILAAAKLTGKTKSGLSLAIMESLTAKEHAQIDFFGQRRRQTVEPFTNYFALRLQKDYRQGDTRLGGMFTAANRDIGEASLEFLHRSAYSGGIDFFHAWKNKTYYVSLKTLFSHVRGSREAILGTQQSSRRYYQRPDAGHIAVDPDRTSLTGHGGTLSVGKEGTGRFRLSTGVTWRSPGLELNDMGYLRSADRIMQWLWVGYRSWKPFAIFRYLGINFNQYQTWDFGSTHLSNGGNINFDMEFKNYWQLGAGIERESRGISTTELRGGPSLIIPSGWDQWFHVGTDIRKKIRFGFDLSYEWGEDNSSRETELGGSIVVTPGNALMLIVSPSFSHYKNQLQYVDTAAYKDDPRYIFARIDQKTFALTIRFDISITPDLTIQFYGQPFISAGKYTDFKKITQPRASAFNDRFHVYSGSEIAYHPGAEVYSFDENGDGNMDYQVAQPNFNFFQFRSNLVIRWEYKPGSTIFLVWSQGRTGSDTRGIFSFSDNFRDLFNLVPRNVFLIKFTHGFNF